MSVFLRDGTKTFIYLELILRKLKRWKKAAEGDLDGNGEVEER